MGAAAAPTPNLVLAGRYRLESRLGGGGMGAIWRAEHLILKAPVAVKLLEREAPPDEDTVARFLREAQAAAALRSPHVVQIIDYGVDGRWPFIVMELLEGENLAQRLKRKKRLTNEETVRILAHVARAMGRAHEAGIVHRDLKPENVFLVHNEDEEIAKVVDFGVAKVSSTELGAESARTRTGSILGTPYYMSPEQAQGNKTVDHRSDLWALAVIAFECLTGKRPFFSDGLGDLVIAICVRDIPVPSEIAPVPIGFDAWFKRAVAREPDNRFQSAREMIEALRDALGVERERSSDPDIVVSSTTVPREGAPSSRPPRSSDSHRPPDSRVPTVVAGPMADQAVPSEARSVIQSARHSGADGNATTMVAAPPQSERPVASSSGRLDFDPLEIEPVRRSSLVPVFGVAAVALGIGLAAGFYVLDREEPAPLPTVTPGLSPVRSTTTPKAKANGNGSKKKAPESTGEAPPASSSEVTVTSPAEAPSASAGKAEPSPPAAKAPPAPANTSKSAASASAAAPAPAPAGTYVKPAWAIPDEEPIRRAPIPKDSP